MGAVYGGVMSKHIDYEINRELGECYLFMGEYDKAGEYYNKAIDCETGRPDPYMGMAAIYIQKGDLVSARQNYQAAVDLEAGDKALAGLGLVEMEMGEHEAAFGHFDQALKINAANMIAMNAMLQLGYKMEKVEQILPHLEASLDEEDNDTIRFTLAGCLSYLGRNGEAKTHLEILLGKDPANSNAQELYAHIAA